MKSKKKSLQSESRTVAGGSDASNVLAVLGPKNTYSDLAGEKFCKKLKQKYRHLHLHSIPDVFEAVERGRAAIGIVPIENILHGTVRQTFDELYRTNLRIREKFPLPVHHALVGLPGFRKNEITTIASHSQALEQCHRYLRKHFPYANRVTYNSTIAALDAMVKNDDRSMLVIIPLETAQKLPVRIVSQHVENHKGNKTDFVVIEKNTSKLKNPVSNQRASQFETTIAFYFKKDLPGNLYEIFKIFAERKINLLHVESRPSPKQFGKYIFFLTFKGAFTEKLVKNALSDVQKTAASVKMLGSYPRS